MSRSPTDHETLVQSVTAPIELVGSDRVVVTGDDLTSLPIQTREIEIVCASGDRYTDCWHGVPILALLEGATIPDETTHLLVESADGYRVCVAVEAALDGLLAVGRNGEPLAAVADHESRFVSSETDGPRTAKAVRRIETRSLAPDDDPESYERFVDE